MSTLIIPIDVAQGVIYLRAAYAFLIETDRLNHLGV